MENKKVSALDLIAFSQGLAAQARIRLDIDDIEGAKKDLAAIFKNLDLVVRSVHNVKEEKHAE